MNSLIQEFIHKTKTLQEVDIGDFRRRLSLYITRLKEDLQAQGKTKIRLNEIQHTTLYSHHADIETLRTAVLEKTANIEK